MEKKKERGYFLTAYKRLFFLIFPLIECNNVASVHLFLQIFFDNSLIEVKEIHFIAIYSVYILLHFFFVESTIETNRKEIARNETDP